VSEKWSEESTSRQFLRRSSTAAIVRDRSFFDGIFGGQKWSEESTSRQFLRRSSTAAIVEGPSFFLMILRE
jgi:hypothetical protein